MFWVDERFAAVKERLGRSGGRQGRRRRKRGGGGGSIENEVMLAPTRKLGSEAAKLQLR